MEIGNYRINETDAHRGEAQKLMSVQGFRRGYLLAIKYI